MSLHAEAPREFTEADSDFLVHAASLVAGAIENARLYEHTRRRLALVEGMADLARAVSAASTLDQLLPAVARRAQRLLGASACEVYVSEPDGSLRLTAASPASGGRARPPSASGLGVVLARGRADTAGSRRRPRVPRLPLRPPRRHGARAGAARPIRRGGRDRTPARPARRPEREPSARGRAFPPVRGRRQLRHRIRGGPAGGDGGGRNQPG